ncbi:PIN domain-containing protein [Klenkia sp. LSe6-5]|uniref:Ribonuclease VapC n=1 Tax=Klenkia sesuvii TaxID=3103137 RepID=A0ABU8DX52_9ACTN
MTDEVALSRFIVDNSVWQRMRQPPVRAEVDRIRAAHGAEALLVCAPVAAEAGFSARSAADHDVVAGALAAFAQCSVHPSATDVLDIQGALFRNGLFRAVGALDTVIAAYAVANRAAVLHYDRDFEHVARVHPGFLQRWIAPAGTLDG